MNIQDLRKEIDKIDDDILRLFLERMAIAKSISIEKKKNNIEILDKNREKEILSKLTENVDESMKEYVVELFTKIMDLSKDYQKNE